MANSLNVLPKPLLDAFTSGRILPVIGAGFSRNAIIPNGEMPTWRQLGELLRDELPSFLGDLTDPVEVLSAYEHEYGRAHLVERLFALLHFATGRPGQAHKAITSLPVDYFLTTNFDVLLENGLREWGADFFPVVEEIQLSLAGSRGERVLIKIHGDLLHPNRLVLTESDFDEWLQKNPLLATEIASLFVKRTGLLIGYSLSDPDLRQILTLLRSRLGYLTRPLYALTVNSRPDEVARFERRGVKVINLKERGNVDARLAELFNQLAEFMRQGGVDRLRDAQPDVADYLVTGSEPSPIVFFSVPQGRLRVYRDYLFPVVIREGLIPYSIDEIPSGVPVMSALEGLIERSVVVVAEPKTEWGKWEHASAATSRTRVLMIGEPDARDGLERVNQELLVRPLPKSEDQWLALAAWFEGWLRDSTFEVRHQMTLEPERLLAAREYRAAVLSASAFLESALRRQLADLVHPNRLIGIQPLLDLAREADLITPREYEEMQRAMRFRNEVAHSDNTVARNDAIHTVEAILMVMRKLG